jgi:serine/threonine protein kinase
MSEIDLEGLYRQQLSSDYLQIEEIGRGGYGITYRAREKHEQRREVVLKLPNLDVRREIDDQRQRLKEFDLSLEAEYQGMRRLEGLRCVARVLRPGRCGINLRGDSLLVPYIVQEYVRGDTFRSYMTRPSFRRYIHVRKAKRNQPHSIFGGIRDPKKYLSLASAIVNAVAEVHKNEVVHGDLWPANIIMRRGEPVIIDFGQSLLLDLVFLAKAELPISHAYAAPERRELNRTWSTAADIYSLGGILFFLATGDPPPDPIENIEELKRFVCNAMKERNRELYLANSGIADVTARCLRSNDRDRPAFAEGVSEELRTFLAGPSFTPPKLDEAMTLLGSAIKQLRRNRNEVFAQIAGAAIRALAWQFNEMSHGIYTLAGHYENIARGMVESLSLLRRGDSYLTLSIPSFWDRAGLGTNGRFLEMNKIAAQNGASIGRVFLLTSEETRSDEVRTILEAHLRIVEELKERNPRISTERSAIMSGAQGLYTGVVIIEEWQRSRLDLLNFGVWSKGKKNQDVLVVPAYREKGKDVAAIRFWAPSIARRRIELAKKQILDFIEKSEPIGVFLATLTPASKERRKCSRELGDERIILDVELKPNSSHARFAPDILRATVVNHSPKGACLKLTALPKNGIPKGGEVIRLIGKPLVRAKCTRRLCGADLKVKWAALSKEPGNSAWTAGVNM